VKAALIEHLDAFARLGMEISDTELAFFDVRPTEPQDLQTWLQMLDSVETVLARIATPLTVTTKFGTRTSTFEIDFANVESRHASDAGDTESQS
jgi:hypothetical protein